ncbi:hypothetical protein Pmani_033272 [Petrolisthes manimaculis]|uniref:Uncharacterized protein n=1 Tax=Petrolisthes manimaculis TaxID=1843537 RepID=A0AAE1TQK8_9EUCA|nr:hypothetical protein Pmani_033272 [Petrolisthes manimaculis]
MNALLLCCILTVVVAAPQQYNYAPVPTPVPQQYNYAPVPAPVPQQYNYAPVPAPVPQPSYRSPVITILRQEQQGPDASGTYSFLYESTDGISRQEQGVPQGPNGAVTSQGRWS